MLRKKAAIVAVQFLVTIEPASAMHAHYHRIFSVFICHIRYWNTEIHVAVGCIACRIHVCGIPGIGKEYNVFLYIFVPCFNQLIETDLIKLLFVIQILYLYNICRIFKPSVSRRITCFPGVAHIYPCRKILLHRTAAEYLCYVLHHSFSVHNFLHYFNLCAVS